MKTDAGKTLEATLLAGALTTLRVGNGTQAESAAQTDLQGASKTALATAVSRTGLDVQFVGFADYGVANHVWSEWGCATAGSGGTLYNRKLQSFNGGAPKTASEQWQLTVILRGS